MKPMAVSPWKRSTSVNGKTSVRVNWIMLSRDQKITRLPLHPTPNLQITSGGDEECLPWTLSRLKWLWPGSELCDLNCPFVSELEWRPDSSLREALAFFTCTSAPQCDGLLVSPLLGSRPSSCTESLWAEKSHTRQYCGGQPLHHRRLLMRNCWGNRLQISIPATLVLLPWKIGVLLKLYGHCWVVYKCGFSLRLREAGIKFAAQDSDHSSPVVWNSVSQSFPWFYSSPILVFLLGFSRFFMGYFCFIRAV